MKSDPKISIVCPLYNKIGYIAKTIESVLCQVDNNWELIIVDDGSSDGSYEAALDHSQRDPRIKLIKRSELRSDVRGANICRNIGVQLATGEYIVFLDADDLLKDYCIKQRIEYINRFPEYNLYVFNVAYCKGEEAIPYAKLKPSAYDYVSYIFTRNKRKYYLKKFLKFDLPWHTSGPVWRKEFLEKIGGFDLTLQRLQDPAIHSKALLDRSVQIKCLMYESSYDMLHRKDEDRVVWSKEEFFKKQLGAIRMYIQTFVPLVEAGGAERYLYLLQGYLLEAEKLVYRHRREGNVSASVMQELNSLYEMVEYRKISTLKYRVFRNIFSNVCNSSYGMRAKIPGILFYFYKKTMW